MAIVQRIDGSIVEHVQLTDVQEAGDEGSRRAVAHIDDEEVPVFNSIIDGFNRVWYEQARGPHSPESSNYDCFDSDL